MMGQSLPGSRTPSRTQPRTFTQADSVEVGRPGLRITLAANAGAAAVADALAALGPTRMPVQRRVTGSHWQSLPGTESAMGF